MDRKTVRLMKQHGVTEDMLLNSEASIEIDILGRKDFFEENLKPLNLEMQSSNDRQLTGGQKVIIAGNLGGIISLLDMCSSQFGNNFKVGVFVAALGCYVLMTVLQAKEYHIENAKKEDSNHEHQ